MTSRSRRKTGDRESVAVRAMTSVFSAADLFALLFLVTAADIHLRVISGTPSRLEQFISLSLQYSDRHQTRLHSCLPRTHCTIYFRQRRPACRACAKLHLCAHAVNSLHKSQYPMLHSPDQQLYLRIRVLQSYH